MKMVSVLCILAASLLSACTQKPNGPITLQLGIWSNYLAPGVIDEFQRRTGHRVQVSHYSSNEELLAKLQAGAGGYDVIVPSDYMVFVMAKLKLLRRLEHAKLTHLAELDPRYLKRRFDPTNEYSVPYDVGTTGIAVNRSKINMTVRGWRALFEAPELAGKISFLDDVRETLGAALKTLGYSLNSRDPEQLKAAKNLLIDAKKRVRAFTSETLSALVNGEVLVAHAYVTDALQAKKATGGKIEYVFPEEGGTFWIDNLVIPAKSNFPDEAHLLVDYLLEAKVVAATAQSIFVTPANKNALSFLPAGFIQSHPEMFPPDHRISKFEMLEDLGEDLSLWERAWTEVKAGK